MVEINRDKLLQNCYITPYAVPTSVTLSSALRSTDDRITNQYKTRLQLPLLTPARHSDTGHRTPYLQ